jgi:hypothetical protein
MKREMGWLCLAVASAVMMNTDKLLGLTQVDRRVLSAQTELTIEERVASLEKRVASLEKKTAVSATKANSVAKESFVQLAGGSGTGVDWVAVSGSEFWLDTSLYGGNVEVSWQGKVEGEGGGAVDGWVRIYDMTNSRGVDYSQVEVAGSGGSSFYSKSMAIWRGQNQYRVEVKSRTGVLMTVVSPRLKVLVK